MRKTNSVNDTAAHGSFTLLTCFLFLMSFLAILVIPHVSIFTL